MDRLITVIVPIYNVERYLERCIESIVNQTYKNIEIILVDDGSPDRCPQICDDWALRDERIVVIHKENGGLSDARNCAIKRAKGEYYLLVDSDDYIMEDAVERLEAYSEDADFIIGETLTVFENGSIIHGKHKSLKENHVYTGEECSVRAIRASEWYAGPCRNMYRTKFIIENELFFKVGILHEDIEYAPRLYLKANKVKYLNYEIYCYMKRSGSICETKDKKHLNDLFQTYEEWKKLNDTIENRGTFRAYAGALAKQYIYTCRKYKIGKRVYPQGITGWYLIKNALNIKELLKSMGFIFLERYM